MPEKKQTTNIKADLVNHPKALQGFSLRGVPSKAINKLPKGGQNAVWSKSYTESTSSNLNSAILTDKQGKVLYATSAPLTKDELTLIKNLGK